MNIVNNRYLQDNQVLTETVDFLKEIIFAPNIRVGQFEVGTLQRKKENLKVYLKNITEDKQTYASSALQSVYSDQSEDQKIPSFGTATTPARETAASLMAYYQKMLVED